MESSSKKDAGKTEEDQSHDHDHSKIRGSIFSVCWDRTGQLLCRGSLDGTMSILSTYNPSKPYECYEDMLCLLLDE